MLGLWSGDLNEHGKEVLQRYKRELPTPMLSSAMGGVLGFFGSGAVLHLIGAIRDEGRYLNWRFAVVVAAATLSGYLVCRYFERREAAHEQAVINALYGSGMSAISRLNNSAPP